MAFRLPRLRDEQIVEGKSGTPLFRRWWSSVVGQIEDAVTSLENIIDGLTGVEGSLTGLQAQADILDNISDATGRGLIEKTGDSAIEIRGIGTDDPAYIPTLLDCDDRYLLSGGTLSASSATTTHKLRVSVGGATYYILLSNV